MRKPYRTIDDVLRSPWAELKPPTPKPVTSDRVLRSTRLEDSIYADLRGGDDGLDQIEQAAAEKLASFPALSRDVYQSFYSLLPRRREESTLSTAARRFNGPILDHILDSEDYPTLKSLIKIPARTACTPSFPPYCVDFPCHTQSMPASNRLV